LRFLWDGVFGRGNTELYMGGRMIMIRFFSLKIFSFLVSFFSVSGIFLAAQVSLAISNGKPVSQSEPIAKSIVFFAEDLESSKRCTGILVGPTKVLTAAHCSASFEKYPGTFKVFGSKAGANCLGSQLKKISFHPDLKDNRFGIPIPDLAIFELESTVCGSEPISFEKQFRKLKNGDVVTTAGYGYGTPDRAILPDRIQLSYPGYGPKEILQKFYADVKKTDFEYFRGVEAMLDLMKNSHLTLFSIDQKSSYCGGDSGGPVYISSESSIQLVGINSAFVPHPTRSKSQCDTFLHQIVPVANYSKWIQENL